MQTGKIRVRREIRRIVGIAKGLFEALRSTGHGKAADDLHRAIADFEMKCVIGTATIFDKQLFEEAREELIIQFRRVEQIVFCEDVFPPSAT